MNVHSWKSLYYIEREAFVKAFLEFKLKKGYSWSFAPGRKILPAPGRACLFIERTACRKIQRAERRLDSFIRPAFSGEA
jgi:hypothetical protein